MVSSNNYCRPIIQTN